MTRAARRRIIRPVVLAAALAFGGMLEAQGTMTEERCQAIMSIVGEIIHEYHGQISTDLITDLQRKVGKDGKCDGPDEYRIWPNTKDREALGRIRSLIAAWDACKKDPAREGCR